MRCQHRHTTFPMRLPENKVPTQRCTDCAFWREYPYIGATPGPWQPPQAEVPKIQKASEIIESRLAVEVLM